MKMGLVIEARKLAGTLSSFKVFLAQVCGKKIYIGHEQPEGFSAPTPFYLFWCPNCSHWAKDYPHGFPEHGRLDCSYCDERHDFIPLWTKSKKKLGDSVVIFIVVCLYFGFLGFISWLRKKLKGECLKLE